jgi:leucyl aminopeptidase
MQCLRALSNWTNIPCDILIVGIPENWKTAPVVAEIDRASSGLISKLLDSGEVSTKPCKLTSVVAPLGLPVKQFVFVGLGAETEWNATTAYRAAASASKSAANRSREKIRFCGFGGTPEQQRAAISGAMVGCVGQDLFRKEKSLFEPEVIEWVDIEDEEIRKGFAIGESVNFTRRLVNLPPNYLYPETFANEAQKLAQQYQLEIEIWDKAKLESERCGSLLGVARGSAREPRLVMMQYRGAASTQAPIAIVGKGVTFDSGGYSLKPTDGMLTMKCDMAGAATTLGILQAAARLHAPVNIVGIIGLVENLVSGDAFKLGDVLTARNGKTIEIHNTDAEGRLVLADCLDVALGFGPAKIVDFATLTGACVVALGNDISGLMTNDSQWQSQIQTVADRCGEYVWPLPMHGFFSEQIVGKVADIKNMGEGRWGGAITAAKFLEEFVGKCPWTHIDIAGPAFLDAPKPWCDAGGTGVLVRTFAELLCTL